LYEVKSEVLEEDKKAKNSEDVKYGGDGYFTNKENIHG
jgi:hypothetical protein